MDFTREPIVESVITPRDGCKLVVRSSKGIAQEEFFVDALEMVSFGGCFFFRSLERPKSFIVPVTDYEVIEVRDTRMVIKSAAVERGSIKIAGGRAPSKESNKSDDREEKDSPPREKKRRRQGRRRRGRDEGSETEAGQEEATPVKEQPAAEEQAPQQQRKRQSQPQAQPQKEGAEIASPNLSSLLPPPKTLISDSIQRYKEDESFKDAFFDADEPREERRKEKPVEAEEPREEASIAPTDSQEEASSEGPFGERGGSEVSGEEVANDEAAPAFDDSHWVIPGLEPEAPAAEMEIQVEEVVEEVAEEAAEETSEADSSDEVVDESTPEEVGNEQGSKS